MSNKNNFIHFDEWCIENIDSNFLEKYWDYNKNIVSPHEIGKSARIKIWIKCQEKSYHNSYEVFAYSFTEGCRCPYCSAKKLHIKDSLGYKNPNIVELWSNKNTLSSFEYSYGSGKTIWLKCPCGKHDDFKSKPYRVKDNKIKCPKCSDENTKSCLQNKVELFINEEFGFTMLFEEDCTLLPKNPKRIKNSNMPFDIEIPKLRLLIEVQGEQHYKITGWTKSHAKRDNVTPENILKQQQDRDRYKKYIAKNNGYNYLAIPYWFEWNDCYKDLIRNKIYEILEPKNGSFLFN